MKSITESINEALLNEAWTDLSDLDDLDLLKVNFMDVDYNGNLNHSWKITLYPYFKDNPGYFIGLKDDIIKIIENEEFADYVNSLNGLNNKYSSKVESLAGVIYEAKCFSIINDVDLKDALEIFYESVSDSDRVSYKNAFKKMFKLKLDKIIDKNYKINKQSINTRFRGFGSRKQMLKRYNLDKYPNK